MSLTLPKHALSIRQPWAWAICHAGKHLENRGWGSWNHHLKRFRGPIAIHASSGMTRVEYDGAAAFMAKNGVICPPPHELVRGAIIGTADVVDWVRCSHSFWFMGPGALKLQNMRPLPEPIPSTGALGYFEWKPSKEPPTPPAKWMLPKGQTTPKPQPQPEPEPTLL